MNKDINIKLLEGLYSFTSDKYYQKIKIFKLPSIGISEFNTSINYSINSNPIITFNFPTGEYTFSFYLIEEYYKTISNICKGTIIVYLCNESCEKCSTESHLLNHSFETCLSSSKYYPLIETKDNTIKKCYDYTTILNLDYGYYLYNGHWNKCYYKCKKYITLGNDNGHKCT